MKSVEVVSAAILLTLLGVTVPAYSQGKHDDKDRGNPHEQQARPEQRGGGQQRGQEHAQPAPQQQRQPHGQPSRMEPQRGHEQPGNPHVQQQNQRDNRDYAQPRRPDQRRDQDARIVHRPEQRNQPGYAQPREARTDYRPQQRNEQQRRAEHDAWQNHRAHSWQAEHRSWQQRGGYHGYRIPDDRFRRSFGHDHFFRIHSQPVMVVGGYPRFQYGGYWVNFVDPWPEYWAPNWYDTDDVYVDYVDNGYYLYNRRHPGVAIAINISF